MARAWMDTYEVTDEDVQLTKEEKVMLHTDAPDVTDPHKIKWRLTHAVSQFCNVQIYRRPHETCLSASACRATCSLPCGCSTRSPISYPPNFTVI